MLPVGSLNIYHGPIEVHCEWRPDRRACSDLCINAFRRLQRRSRLSLRANDSILSPMFAPIAAELKGEFDISYLPFDLQVSQQRGWRSWVNTESIWNPQPPVLRLQSFFIRNIVEKMNYIIVEIYIETISAMIKLLICKYCIT